MIRRIEKLLEKTGKDDLVMDPVSWRKYSLQRVGWKDDDGNRINPANNRDDYNLLKETVNRFVIHNGSLGSEVLEEYDGGLREMDLNLGRERVFLDEREGTMHIAQPVSKSRGERFEDMIYTGCVLSCPDWNVSLESRLLNDDRHHTLRRYSDLAYDFVKDVSLTHDKLDGIDFITLGPLKWFKKYGSDVDVIEENNNEYLNYMITEIEGKKTLNLDYVFSDQAKEIVDQLLRTYYGETPDHAERRRVNILMYGKVGGIAAPKNSYETVSKLLNDRDISLDEIRESTELSQNINDIVIPNGIVSTYDIEYNNDVHTRLANVFSREDKAPDYILNSTSVPLQKISTLQKGFQVGCNAVEMESHYATQVINTARSQFHNLEIRQGFVGFISDLPLYGTTLAENPDQRKGREKSVNVVEDHIKTTAQ